MDINQETLVVRAGRLRIVLLSILLSLCAAVFLFMAAVCVMIQVDQMLLRVLLWLVALLLVGLAVFMLFVLNANACRIEVAQDKLRLRMPRTRGPLVLPGSIRAELPYRDIKSVERREEVYDSLGLVTVQTVFSLVTQDGRRWPLGVMAENWGFQLPFDKAAAKIAERSGCAVLDRGAVRVGGVIRALVRGVPPWTSESMPLPERTRWHKRGALTMQIIMVMVFAILILRACTGS